MSQGSIDVEKFKREVPGPEPATGTQKNGSSFNQHSENALGDDKDRANVLLQSKEQRKHQLILPSGDVSITESAEQLFEGLSKIRRYFVRGRLVMELAPNKNGNEILIPLRATALRSRIEESFRPYVWPSSQF